MVTSTLETHLLRPSVERSFSSSNLSSTSPKTSLTVASEPTIPYSVLKMSNYLSMGLKSLAVNFRDFIKLKNAAKSCFDMHF